jgi:hypothetical protein
VLERAASPPVPERRCWWSVGSEGEVVAHRAGTCRAELTARHGEDVLEVLRAHVPAGLAVAVLSVRRTKLVRGSRISGGGRGRTTGGWSTRGDLDHQRSVLDLP